MEYWLNKHAAVEKFPIDFSEIRLERIICATILQPFDYSTDSIVPTVTHSPYTTYVQSLITNKNIF